MNNADGNLQAGGAYSAADAIPPDDTFIALARARSQWAVGSYFCYDRHGCPSGVCKREKWIMLEGDEDTEYGVTVSVADARALQQKQAPRIEAAAIRLFRDAATEWPEHLPEGVRESYREKARRILEAVDAVSA